jgi:hypothetical protein
MVVNQDINDNVATGEDTEDWLRKYLKREFTSKPSLYNGSTYEENLQMFLDWKGLRREMVCAGRRWTAE